MKAPRKAIVLCAGFGTRMAPLSQSVPKPLMPVWGTPLIDHLLAMLHDWGVRDVLVNLHHSPGPLTRHLLTRRAASPRLAFSFEPTILGTGGALRKAEWFIGHDPFWIVNGDVAMDLSPRPLLTAFARARPLAALWVTSSAGPRTMEIDDDTVLTFRSHRAGTSGTYTFCGLHLASPRVLEHLRDRPGFSSIIDVYTDAIRGGETVLGIRPRESFWADTGTVKDYLDAHRGILRAYRKKLPGRRLMSARMLKPQSELKRNGVVVNGFAAVCRNARIAPGARLTDSVLLDGADIGPRATVARAIVGPGTKVRGNLTRMALRAGDMAGADLLAMLENSGFPPSRTTARPMAPRGSARSFARLVHGARRAILMRYSLERPENGLYVRHARFLHRLGVPVPAILANDPEAGLVLIEDAGDRSLLDCVHAAAPATVVRHYRKVLDAIAPMHKSGAAKASRSRLPLCEPFSRSLYDWEHDLFATQFLRGTLGLSHARITSHLKDLRTVSERLLEEPRCLLHRDLQSTNVLVRRGGPVFVDFQGMRMGLAAYDLASLLCDPYVSLPSECQDTLIAYYAGTVGIPERRLRDVFWYAAVQRLVQAIGAYARLGSRRETRRFSGYIAPGLAMLRRSLANLDGLDALKGLA